MFLNLLNKYITLGIIRHHDTCIKTFLEEGGCTGLEKMLKHNISTLQIKAAFLITCIYPDNTHIASNYPFNLNTVVILLLYVCIFFNFLQGN